jgi:L-amino acid N-acyltransferase YncA
MDGITFRAAVAADWPAVSELLTQSGLPLAGAEEQLNNFVLAVRGEALLASAGLEVYGTTALLRSVAVSKADRGTGLGQEIVRLLLDHAYETGLTTVVLLTTTADRFFPRFGFVGVTWAELPAAVFASAELQGACPSSATVMRLDLDRAPLLVRPATEVDIPAITRIYNQGIADKATLETQLRTYEERHQWLTSRSERYPVTVAVRQGEVIGWASISPFNVRQAYRFVGDLSVYVERDRRRTGAGLRLMQDLMERAKGLEYHKLVLTTFPHLPAVKLYEKLGFRHVGDYREQGLLDGAWVDTRIMEYIL